MKNSKAYHADYRAKHKEEIKASKAAYYATHKEEQKVYDAAYRVTHKEEIKVSQASYQATHKEEIKASKAIYRAAHKEEIKASKAAYYAKPDIKTKRYSRKHKIAHKEVLPWFLIPETERRCWMCEEKGENMHLDHDHEIRKIRGWSHHLCNTAEGIVMKSPNPDNLIKTLSLIRK